ncbi:MAG: threonine/serine exporter family protein [Eubacteriales bacterium]|nr:threonine/serine exporter family protein [Eubacteriales bacterium]MDD3198101.1 threonine/serine exporter family protein [Eubacteriales bacterium]MDD3504878.1 threonine/serine exporter family protein [Eubacteriales bacterium]MDD4682699.1 threonine/serine exporter family protein [Eubacteriales bacterium]
MISEQENLLALSLNIGRGLLENGAETYRVEESIGRIMTAYGMEQAEVFAIPTCIIASVSRDGQTLTRVERITQRRTNLDRISRLNNLSREICDRKYSTSVIKAELNKIMSQQAYPFWLQTAGFVLVAAAFTIMFGGDFRAALAAALCGLVTKPVIELLQRYQTNVFFANIIGGAVIAAVALAASRLGLSGQVDLIIIGTLMNLVPGVAITNSMRDIIAGDLVAGLTKLTEALIIGTAIAIGTGFTFSIVGYLL